MDAGTSRKPFPLERRDPKKCSCGDKFLSLFFPLLLNTPVFAVLEGRKTEALELFASMFSDKPRHLSRLRRQTTSRNEVPMYSFTSPGKHEEKKIQKRRGEKHQQLIQYARRRETKK